MSDASTVQRGRADMRYPVNVDAIEAAFDAKGALRDEDRAALLRTSRRAVYRLLNGETIPRLDNARRISQILETPIDVLWPPTKAAA